MTDAVDGGVADRGGGRGSYRVIDFNAGKFCSGHIALRRALSPTFRAGAMLLIIPWRGWAHAASDAALLDRREPPIFRFSKFRCGPIDGARALELFAATGSLHIGAGRDRTGRGAPVYSIGWRHARARAVADSAAADFYFAIIRSRPVGPTAW